MSDESWKALTDLYWQATRDAGEATTDAEKRAAKAELARISDRLDREFQK